MNRKMILLNLALIALAVAIGWTLRRHRIEAQIHERAIVEQAAKKKPVLPPPPITPPKAVTPAEYIDVASRMLFASDRNPNVIIEPPKPAPPPPPMPALPAYFGQMAIGQPTVLLSTAPNDPQKSYHAGDKIGPFEIVSFDHEKIAFKWNDKTVERKVRELAPKEAPVELTQPVAAAQPQQARPQSQSLGSGSSDLGNKSDPHLGDTISGTEYHACVTGDTSPAGTIAGEYKKVMTRGLMGQTCYWERVAK